ncbi:unnamed protein product [Cylindrotheca closterium]|uniref:Uncharacterized protein n=1 Tax=Cylindrotheca closterium TaxID=2856 RepID=A0AAD2FGN5_9STRA|nr:unnamed protein product [Cylindrotheca closterium]
MALHIYFSELMATKGMEHAQLVRDDARITQNPKLTMPKRRSRTRRHPTFRPTTAPGGCCMATPSSSLPSRPSRKGSNDDLVSIARCTTNSTTAATNSTLDQQHDDSNRSSLELFYSEVAPRSRRISK